MLDLILKILWITVIGINFIVQIKYFHEDSNHNYFRLKKITTPAMLFIALAIVLLADTASSPVIPAIILTAMGIGELGIEGSSVVESSDDTEGKKDDSIIVLIAGILFLLVNIFIGSVLLYNNFIIKNVITIALLATGLLSSIIFILIKKYKPGKEITKNIVIYSTGIGILFTGALSDLLSSWTLLGKAAAVLTVSDLLVLIRMGADFDKESPRGFRILLSYLVIILILYYIYVGLLIHMVSPFGISL